MNPTPNTGVHTTPDGRNGRGDHTAAGEYDEPNPHKLKNWVDDGTKQQLDVIPSEVVA